MRKFFGISVVAAVALVLSGPAAAELWNIDFDTGTDADGNQITFAGETIFSGIGSDTDWQRYDGAGTGVPNGAGALPGRTNPGDSGIFGSNGVTFKIDVWNGRGTAGYAVGFDSTNPDSRDNDLEDPFKPTATESQVTGYGNILIIQSHEKHYTTDCGNGANSGGNGLCKYQTHHSHTHGHSKSDDEARGGDITFDFGEAVRLVKMNVFDIEEEGGKVLFDKDGDGFFESDGSYDEDDEQVAIDLTTHNQGYYGNADNGVGLLTFNGDIGIIAHKMMVWLPGSGAIDNIMGDNVTTSNVAEPSVLALFGAGLIGLSVYRRRRPQV